MLSVLQRQSTKSRFPFKESRQAQSAARAFALAALMVLGVSGWLGGEIVFSEGWRVTPAEHDELLEDELQKNGQSDQVKRVHEIVKQYKERKALIP